MFKTTYLCLCVDGVDGVGFVTVLSSWEIPGVLRSAEILLGSAEILLRSGRMVHRLPAGRAGRRAWHWPGGAVEPSAVAA